MSVSRLVLQNTILTNLVINYSRHSVLLIKHYWAYIAAALLVLGLLVYSFWLHTGYKEDHLGHLIYAAIWFPLIANTFSANSFVKDFIFGSVLIAIILVSGNYFWEYQDTLTDFSFENWYEWKKIIYFFCGSFVLSQLVKILIGKIRK